MVAFRKWFPVLAIFAVMFLTAVPASAQVTTTGMICNANAGAPPTIRAEGITELVGDVVLVCNGGIPAGQPNGPTQVPLVNFQIFLNTNVTSRILASGNLTEALLLIDEPSPTNQRACVPAPNSGSSCANQVFPNPGNPSGVIYGNGLATTPNVYQGQLAGANSIVWLGIPLDAPGTTAQRIIRITNVRANANQLGVSSTLIPSQVVEYISASSTTTVTINNPSQIVGFVLPGLVTSLSGAPESFLQCVSFNPNVARDPSRDFQEDVPFAFTLREGFASSWKVRGVQSSPANPLGGTATGPVDQDVPGATYLAQGSDLTPPSGEGPTETGFYNPDMAAAGGGAAGNNLQRAGLADHGTRLMVRFAALPTGVQVFVPATIIVTRGSDTVTYLQLVATDAAGAGGYQAISATTDGFAPVSLTAGGGTAVYEVLETDVTTIESVTIDVQVAFVANPGSNIPSLTGTTPGVASANFAPLSTVTTASATAPIPRFADSAVNRTAVIVNACSTNLLYPFVANTDGFDTGLVISNTSLDPFGTGPQTGACNIHYYGTTTGGGAAPGVVTTAVVPAGSQVIWTLSAGGGVVGGASTAGLATPGFRGYIIARCAFQYAHGFAFVSDLGANRLAEGYLALVLDEGIPSRTGFASETLGH